MQITTIIFIICWLFSWLIDKSPNEMSENIHIEVVIIAQLSKNY